MSQTTESTEGTGRIERCFEALRKEGRAAFIPFIMGGDPNLEDSETVLAGLPEAGADLIEIGMPFSDPMADGPSVELAGLRALAAGQTMVKTLAMVSRFRANNDHTPIILMGYFNPIYHYGVGRFLADAKEAGVDGFIIVDLPHEEDDELCIPALEAGLSFVRLLPPPAINDARLSQVMQNTSGFLYYVSIAGITGAAMGGPEVVKAARAEIAKYSDLPVAVGFGIRTCDDVAAMAGAADAVVVGSALLECLEKTMKNDGTMDAAGHKTVLDFVRDLASGVRDAK
jgi:tryptophan synthase alpha chain